MTDHEMEEALRAAAECDNHSMSRMIDPAPCATDAQIKKMKHIILVFLQGCPDDASVLEMRELLE